MRATVLLVAMTCACSHSTSNKDSGAPALPTVVLHASGRTVRVEVEVVRTSSERAKGLMYRRELPAHRGMLFIFERQEIQSFWMQNTYIPLDMIFIDERMRVVGIVENAAPLTTEPRKVAAPSRFVLEVNGGFSKQNGIGLTTRVVFDAIGPP